MVGVSFGGAFLWGIDIHGSRVRAVGCSNFEGSSRRQGEGGRMCDVCVLKSSRMYQIVATRPRARRDTRSRVVGGILACIYAFSIFVLLILF